MRSTSQGTKVILVLFIKTNHDRIAKSSIALRSLCALLEYTEVEKTINVLPVQALLR